MAERTCSKFSRTAVWISRLAVSACFIFSGFVKAVDPVGTQIKIQDYLSAFGAGTCQDSLILPFACLLAGLEFVLGVYLLFGMYRNGTTLLLLTVLALFTPFTLYLAIANPVSDCGCFGDAVTLSNWQTFLKNVVLLLMAIYVRIYRSLVKPLIQRWEWLFSLAVVIIAVLFMRYNVRNLPVLDFRPYKIGVDLRSGVLEGRDDTFGDFFLMDSELNDVTADVLESDGFLFLLVAPHLDDASQRNVDRINDLCSFCIENGYPLYCVTASGTDEAGRWAVATCAEYDFLFADEIPLQTMIRSNPGVVVIRDGVIIDKWSDVNIPVDSDIPALLGKWE